MDTDDGADLAGKAGATQDDSQSTYCESQEVVSSDNLFPESPSYDLPAADSCDSIKLQLGDESAELLDQDINLKENIKRKLPDNAVERSPKLKKVEDPTADTQALDEEISAIWSCVTKRGDRAGSPTPRKLLTPVRSSPRKITKRSNSCTTCCEDTRPKTFRPRAASTDETPPTAAKPTAASTIPEEKIDPNDSQAIHLELSSSWVKEEADTVPISDPPKLSSARSILALRHKSRLSDERALDHDSTESNSSIILDSPDAPHTLADKLIKKLSNGDSSTPTDGQERSSGPPRVTHVTDDTPSTISPLQNGRPCPLRTPRLPVFDVHVGHDEDGELLSMYVVRTDHEFGQDMAKEFNRLSKRFTIDPYLGDVSKNTSPSSVTSGAPITLPLNHPAARGSFASTTSSSVGSNRTSDGAFVVPPPPTRSTNINGTTGIKGYGALLRKLREIIGVEHDESQDNGEKTATPVVQPTHSSSNGSNGVASPEEIARCDRATPKSSLKKMKGRGKRPLPGKTKRALLPTQVEEPEYQATLNSPEMLPSSDSTLTVPAVLASPRAGGSGRGRTRKLSRPESPRPTPPPPVQRATPAPGTLVLAKWIDKRYYSGKVVEVLEGNKYQIEFDDGHSKVLPDESVIFGDERQLPLKGQSVYAVVDDQQNYEPGLVLDVECGEGGALYKCTTDGEMTVIIMANELYMTEDQARSLLESKPSGVPGTPGTPRRRLHRDLDLDNIIHGPRSARARRKRSPTSPASPQASTSGTRIIPPTPQSSRKRRQVSECSELSEGTSSLPPPPPSLEEVAGVEPEMHKTPRKIDGVKAGPLQLKGAARQTVGKKNSKLTQFENDDVTVSLLGPIPEQGSRLFAGLHFLLTCSGDVIPRTTHEKQVSRNSDHTETEVDTDHEGKDFSLQPFHKERLREQLEAGGATVYSHFDDIPKQYYPDTRLIAPRPCRTAKYIQCLAAGIKAVTHNWVIASCSARSLCDQDTFILPAGWSLLKKCFINWSDRGDGRKLRKTTVAICGEPDTFNKFWSRVCSLAGIEPALVNEDQPQLGDAVALLTDPDCPHEVQNKAHLDAVPLVSTQWLWQCIIEGRVCPPTGHAKFAFDYTEPD